MDGLGGLPIVENGPTELEAADTPNLDALARAGICGLHHPIGPGITPGSGPAHMALFGYDPIASNIGRGVLEALGVDFDLRPEDIAARGNFATMNRRGIITDRRAGRISSEQSTKLCDLLNGMPLDGVRVFVRLVREHRFLAVFRDSRLTADLTDSDPQRDGLAPKPIEALNEQAVRAAAVANRFVAEANARLAGRRMANTVLLRGFSQHPRLPTMQERYLLQPAAIAAYPMYRGLAKLAGMEVLPTGPDPADEFEALSQYWSEHDFFFLHVKKTDAAGEDGDFERKVRAIEEVDALVPRLMALGPDVVVVTGDHSTPAALRGHSWHPVPVLLWSHRCRADGVVEFSERACRAGGLGRFPAVDIMPLALANALKLGKFGA